MWLIVHFIIIIGVSIRVLLRPHREPASRVAWILFIAAVPYVGALLYLMLGEVRSAHTAGPRKLLKHAQRISANHSADSAGISNNASPGFAVGESIGGFAPVAGNSGRLLEDSNATIDALVADVDAARDHVHLLFYIWLPDNNGRKVVEAMIRAAERGVTCRVIVDDLGSRSFIRSEHWSALDRAGVQLTRAQPIGNVVLRILKGRVDVRNHRKIVVIDNQTTYCGSQNCADPEFTVKAKYAPWVDAVIRFEGPIVRQNQQLFLADWLKCTNEDLSALANQSIPKPVQGFVAQVIGTGPEVRYSAMPELFATLMFSARRELVITTPYYVPDDAMQAAFCTSARRGTVTILIVPARNDSWFVGAASRSYYADLLDAGVCIYEYVGGLLHTKSLTLDGEITLIGSANMDRRSFDLNFENNILFQDPDLTRVVRSRQQDYIDKSRSITHEDIAKWSVRYRLRNNAMAILGPVL
ncbi:MAG: cardiolipin synthase [Gemmatimonadaceae bacterium]